MYRRTFDDMSLKNYRVIDLRSDTLVGCQYGELFYELDNVRFTCFCYLIKSLSGDE
jgi:hypothetical protein